MDETKVQVLKEKNRKATMQSFMRCMAGLDPGIVAVVFHYSPSRSSAVALCLLGAFSGNMITDGYSGYKAVANVTDVRHGACWSHARRYFHKAY